MRYAIALLLLAHGIAHVPGFAVPWRLLSSPEMPYTTTILSGRWDVGPTGIRVVGIAWLVAGVMFVAAAVAYARYLPSSVMLITSVAVASLALCVLNWPLSRIGFFVNLVIILGLPLIGQLAWRDATAARVRSMANLVTPANAAINQKALASAPAPVARYLSRALTDGQTKVTSARFEQAGDFRVGDAWYPFRARQEFSVEPAGFVWDAHIAMSRLMPVLVRDSYVGGAGSMRGEVLAVYPLVNQANRPELDAGALQRFLAESVWFPSALLPRQNLTWEPIDARRAKATLTDRHTTVSLEFRFNDDGDVTEIFAPDRFAENHGRYEPKPWIVRCSEYELHAGMRIPALCEVAWIEGTTPVPYWRGRITDARYNELPVTHGN